MRSRSRAEPLIKLVAALIVIALASALSWSPVTADAAGGAAKQRPAAADPTHPNEGGSKKGGGGKGEPLPPPTPANAGAQTSGGDETPGGFGTVNSLAIRNPICDEALKEGQARNCENTGSPEARFSTSNYGLEIHVETGLTHISGNFQYLLAAIAGAIWTALLFVLNLVLSLLGFAFSLNPFGDGQTMGSISTTLERFYRAFTSPWLVLAFVSLGAWGVYKGLLKREVGASVAGMAVSVALMITGLIVLHEPKATVGTLAGFSNDAAQTVIGAPLKGSLDNPSGNYAAATADTWNAMTLPGFAALNFSDVGWALSKPDKDLVDYADHYACLDYAYLKGAPPGTYETLSTAVGAAAALSGDLNVDCSQVEAATGNKIPRPQSNAEIWLRNSNGSLARTALYEKFHDELPYARYLAIEGGGGAWTRLPLVVVIALGLLGGILLLSYLAIKLFTQTAIGFVLLLAAPVALFLPAFGEKGRSSFVLWATTLLGALISKVVYAALLAIILAATSVASSLASGSGGIGTMAAFLVSSGLWWTVFLKRETLLGFISIGREQQDSGSLLRNMLGLRMAQQMGSVALGPLKAAGGAAAGAGGGAKSGFAAVRGQLDDGREGARSVAEAELDRSAQSRLDGKYDEAQDTVAAYNNDQESLRGLSARHESAQGELGELRANPPAAGVGPEAHDTHQAAIVKKQADIAEIGEQRRAAAARVRAGAAGARGAQALVSKADEQQTLGASRWSGAQIQQAQDGLRSEADLPVSDAAHAWRAGMSPKRYGELEGREREEAHTSVAESLRRDRVALGTISDRPPGISGEQPTDRRGARQMQKEIHERGDPELKRELSEQSEAQRSRRSEKPRRGESPHVRPRGPSRRNLSGR